MPIRTTTDGPSTTDATVYRTPRARKAIPVESRIRSRARTPDMTGKHLLGHELRWVAARSGRPLIEVRSLPIADVLREIDGRADRPDQLGPDALRKLLAALKAETEIVCGLDAEIEGVIRSSVASVQEIMLVRLLAYAKQEGRVCPMPQQWHQMYLMLCRAAGYDSRSVTVTEVLNDIRLAPPLILGAWGAIGLEKRMRLEEHIRFAAANDALAEVDEYLRSLPRDQWFPDARPAIADDA